MELSSRLPSAAARLGLDLEIAGSKLRLTRHGITVELVLGGELGEGAPRPRLHAAAWIFFGVRLGLDKRAEVHSAAPSTPLRFRRTTVRRYHEAPSVHGESLAVLVPQITRQTFEVIAETKAFYRSWIQDDLNVLIIDEEGTRREVMTVSEQSNSELSDEVRWEKVRSALFYESYKLRPRDTLEVAGGSLRHFETTEGYGASRALLLPEFDYDASRDYGFLAVPTGDEIVVARPNSKEDAPTMLQELRDLVDDCTKISSFGLSDAIFQLKPDEVSLLSNATFCLGEQFRSPDELVVDVDAP